MLIKSFTWEDIAGQKHTIDIHNDGVGELVFYVTCWTSRPDADSDEWMWGKRFATDAEATAEALRFAPAGSEV